ncbi:MAG: MoaD/ThiS family protein [Youngiibacter sp.]|nr:MoaD/ThiS family protein [Youngiibacter sp.]
MITVTSEEYVNSTILDALEYETKKNIYGDLFTQPFLVTVNGRIITEDLYGKIIINKSDEIRLLPLYAGG